MIRRPPISTLFPDTTLFRAEEPSWTQIRLLARSLGATVKILPLRPENGWKPDPDELKRLLSPRTKLVYLNHPNNPTGSARSEEHTSELQSRQYHVCRLLLAH